MAINEGVIKRVDIIPDGFRLTYGEGNGLVVDRQKMEDASDGYTYADPKLVAEALIGRRVSVSSTRGFIEKIAFPDGVTLERKPFAIKGSQITL